MTKVIAIINQKGGVGKTATTCNLAYCFAGKNKRTLLVDLDPSANATHVFLQGTPTLTVKDFILSKETNPFAILPSFQGEMPVNNLCILPSHISLAMTERELANRPFRETLLSKKLHDPKISNHFDYILIDCPPTLTTLTINAIYAADFILIPVTYSKDALEGVADLFEILSEIKEGHTYGIKILRNGYDARKKTANAFIAEKLHQFILQGLVLNTIIRQDEQVNRATLENLTVMTYARKAEVAEDYINLRNELEDIFNGGN
jgi:chromosome partitioning protein